MSNSRTVSSFFLLCLKIKEKKILKEEICPSFFFPISCKKKFSLGSLVNAKRQSWGCWVRGAVVHVFLLVINNGNKNDENS